MRLIKLMYNFNTPLKEDVKALFPRDNEQTLKENYIIVSDSKYWLLKKNHVNIYTYKEFTETAVHTLDNFVKFREDYMIVKKIVKPSEFDPETIDISDLEVGDFVFFYEEGPVRSEPPVKPKFHSGTFNYELSEADKKLIMQKYEEDYANWESNEEAYQAALETFMDTEANLPIFGVLGIVVNPETKFPVDTVISTGVKTPYIIKDNVRPATVITVKGDKKIYLFGDASFETTKDVRQFDQEGKIPKGRPTKVKNAIGGLKAGQSLLGWSYRKIAEKLFGLEYEKNKVGTLQPDGSNTGRITPTVSYGEGKTAIGSLTDTATITATITLPENSPVTTIKLVKSDGTVVDSQAKADTVTFSVTGIDTTTSYIIKAVYTDPETSEEVVAKQTTITVVVNFVAPNATLTANPAYLTTVGNVTLTANITAGSSNITKVELFNNAIATGTPTETETSGFDNLEWEIQDVDETCAYSIKVTDANGLTKTAFANITVEDLPAQIYFGDYNEYYSIQPGYNYNADEGLTNADITDVASAYFIAHAGKHINSNQTFTTKGAENTYDMVISRPNVTGTWAVAIPNTVNMRIYETALNMDATDSTLTVRGTYTADGITYNIYASKNYTDTGDHDIFYLISAN